MSAKVWTTRENLNRNEQWKLAKDGLEIFQELPELVKKPFAELAPDDIERIKWAGFYLQKPKDGHFLVRVKLPSGQLNAEQAHVIAGIARDFGDGIQITIRQSMEIHSILLTHLQEVLDRLHAVGLSSTEACGDVPRTIMGNALAGIDPDELLDTRPIVNEVYNFFLGNPDFSNLPRKFKISISASPYNAGSAEINDFATVPAVKDGIKGFQVYLGGGLSAEPYLAQKAPFFLKPEDVLPAAKAVATIFRDYGPRVNRKRCRIKYLLEEWGIEKLAAKMDEINGKPFERGGQELTKGWNHSFYYGVHEQKQKGYFYFGTNQPTGHLDADDMDEFARLSSKYGEGTLRTTNTQNLILTNIPAENVVALEREPIFQKYPLQPNPFVSYALSCTGNAYCNFAPIETKQRQLDLTQALAAAFPEIDTPIYIAITGCIHACAHPQLVDIGFTGGRAKVNGQLEDAFTVQLGGSLGPDAKFAEPLTGKIPGSRLTAFTKSLVQHYLDHRQLGEAFYQFVRRTDKAEWQALLDAVKI